MAIINWVNIEDMDEKKWICGHCGEAVAGNRGYYKNEAAPSSPVHFHHPHHQLAEQARTITKKIFLCPNCDKPTYFEGNNQVPGATYGKPVLHLPTDLDEIYNEARNCMSVNAFVPAVLTARTILMHVAVEQGAAEGLHFGPYVDYLVKGGFVPPNATKWVDHIRVKGNAATHKIALMNRDDAEKVLRFVEMILLFLYEYPNVS